MNVPAPAFLRHMTYCTPSIRPINPIRRQLHRNGQNNVCNHFVNDLSRKCMCEWGQRRVITVSNLLKFYTVKLYLNKNMGYIYKTLKQFNQ